MDIFQILTSSAWSVLMIAVFFGGSIFVHELGHFWVAKKRGVKVERFSIGFGPAIFKWVGKDGVEYRLSWLPLGGYVALPQLADMRGLEGEPSAETAALPSPGYTTRMLVFGAGAFMNIVFAFALATILWQVGMPANADTQRTKIGYVAPTIKLADGRDVPSPAAAAGIRPGDFITEVDGNEVRTWDEMRQMLFTGSGRTSSGEPQALITVKRGAETLVLTARPILTGEEQMRTLGVSPWQELKIAELAADSAAAQAGLKVGDRLAAMDGVALTSFGPFGEALRAAAGRPVALEVERAGQVVPVTLQVPAKDKLAEGLGISFDAEVILIHPTPWKQISDNARMTVRTFSSLLSRDSDVGISKLSGPIGIARVFHLTAQTDIRLVLWFTILVNVNLAIFNLLPLPVLDGGHMLFATIGKLRGRSLPIGFIQRVQTGFVALLFTMMIYVSFFDVRRIARDGASAKAEPAAKAEAGKNAEPAK